MKPSREDIAEDSGLVHGYAVVSVHRKTGKREIVGSTASGVRTLDEARRHRDRCAEGYLDEFWKGNPPTRYVVVKLVAVD